MNDNEVVIDWCGEKILVVVDFLSDEEIEWHTSDPDFDRAVRLDHFTSLMIEDEIAEKYLSQNKRNFEEYEAGV